MRGALLALVSAAFAAALVATLPHIGPSASPGPPAARATSAPPEVTALARWSASVAEHGLTVQATPGTRPLVGWRVRDHLSAHHVLIVRVETDRLNESLVIAQLLVEPVKARYAEALVYFYRPGGTRLLKRVQWTPQAGYVETTY